MVINNFFVISLISLFFACDTDSSTGAKTTVERNDSEQIYITLQAKNSPLQTVEFTREDLPAELIATLQRPDESVAVANVLRAPCLEEWSRGDTLNQSLQAGQCSKSVDWMKAVDAHLASGKTFQDVLFIMVAPGPYLPDMNSNHVSVIVDKEQLRSGLLQNRTQFFLKQSMNVKVFIDSSDGIHEIDIECINDGHNLSGKVDESSCFRNNTTEVDASILTAIQAQQKPIWLIRGYRLSGFQSIEQLSRVIQLP